LFGITAGAAFLVGLIPFAAYPALRLAVSDISSGGTAHANRIHEDELSLAILDIKPFALLSV
jgi:hypothetical protein